ncbi:hypothetical protein IAE35_04290 [Pseudomonas sp. S75]|uniref:hypothetical protein n=1 Tax=unclassified Pseudomonas TaxID=196821 RepID=UPI001902FDE2|nr:MULTISPECIES: hypothetical protein [unclassified Pseudomonas]MBJ9974697.1 hypothetical protein [Pseudomonas sp. S30]MBK0152547.1 hypothetical protein [Pseudomonas sp. S75]
MPELYFTDLNDSATNPRLGLGYDLLKAPVRLHASMVTLPRVNDEAVLYWNDVPVDKIIIDPVHVSSLRLEFTVPVRFIRPPSGRVYYTYEDTLSGAPVERSPERTIAVNTLVPGGSGQGPDPQPPYNNALAPCIVQPNPVTHLGSPVTVQVPRWINKEIGDELTVRWGNLEVSHPKVTDPAAVEWVSIPQQVLLEAGTHPSVPVTYYIRDLVDNFSRLARPVQVAVQLSPSTLRANGSRVDLIDLRGLTQLDVQVPDYGMQPGDQVTVLWQGATPRQKTEPVIGNGPLTIPLDLAWARESKDRQVTVSYSVARVNGTLTSSAVVARVKESEEQVSLPAPTVQDLQNGMLDQRWLRKNRNGEATVVVPAYTGMRVGHSVRVTWSNNINWNTPVQTVRAIGPMEFKIQYTEIIDTIGGTANVNYTVLTEPNGPVHASPFYRCRVKDNPAPFQSMPPPIMARANQVRIAKTGNTAWRVKVLWAHPESGWAQESPLLRYSSNGQAALEWTVPAAWIAANRGRRVYVNYSMSQDASGGTPDTGICFSRYLHYDVPA